MIYSTKTHLQSSFKQEHNDVTPFARNLHRNTTTTATNSITINIAAPISIIQLSFHPSSPSSAPQAHPVFTMSILIISLTHLALTCYALYLSYQNITRLQQYEKTSEKAAQWSNTAAQKLQKTRTTQASGTIVVRFIHLHTQLPSVSKPSIYPKCTFLLLLSRLPSQHFSNSQPPI